MKQMQGEDTKSDGLLSKYPRNVKFTFTQS